MTIKRKELKQGKSKIERRKVLKKRPPTKRGDGIIDKVIDKLPFEMHVPGYQYCGPGIYDLNHLHFKFKMSYRAHQFSIDIDRHETQKAIGEGRPWDKSTRCSM